MKKRIQVIIPILILVILSVFIYYFYNSNKEIHVNKDNLISTNLYKFKVTNDYEQILAIKEYNKYLYILILTNNETNKLEYEYVIKKINIETSKCENETTFKSSLIEDPIIKISSEYIKIISRGNINIHIFDVDLKQVNEFTKSIEDYDSYGEYEGKVLTTKDNNIYIDGEIYDTVLKSCDKSFNIIYKNNTYIYFNNYNLNVSCLYNVNNKKINYLDNSEVEPFDGGYLTYNYESNKITLKKETEEKYYLSSKDETAFITITSDGSLLGTYNDSIGEFKVYNLANKKIFNKLKIEFEHEYYVPIMILSDYMYIVSTNGEKSDVYLWDFKKDTLNENMLTYINSKNKIDSYELVTKIKEEFNINTYIYDKGVRYFSDFYALPNYDDELTYDRLSKTYDVLKKFNKDFFNKFKTNKNNGLEIYITGTLYPSDITTQISNPVGYSLKMNNDYIIAIDANDEEYDKTMCHELMHSIENNMYDLYYDNKLKNEPFKKWNSYNPKNFKYSESYVKEENDKYTISSNKDVYFIDSYSHTYSNEDRARIFEQLCSKEDTLNKYSNLKKKALYLKSEITSVYPMLNDSSIFSILK